MSAEDRVLEIYSEILANGVEEHAGLLTLAVVIYSAMADLSSSTRAIAHGDVSGATGLEGLAMAIAGVGLHHPLSEAIENIGNVTCNFNTD